MTQHTMTNTQGQTSGTNSGRTSGSPSGCEGLLAGLRRHRDAVYARGKVEGEFGKAIDTFPTGITQARGRQLGDVLRGGGGGVSRTIETGFALGLSSLFIVEAALEGGGDVQHTAVDPFQRSDWNNAGVRMVKE